LLDDVNDRVGGFWRNLQAERVMNLLGVKPGLRVADIGAGSGYYTVRLAGRLGATGHVFAEDVVPEYLERLARRVANEGLAGRVTIVRGDPHDPRLPPGSVDLALLVHMYHEVQQPYGLLWNLRPALRPRRPCRNHRRPQADRGARHPAGLAALRTRGGRVSSDRVQ
jgi:ubiquinone/menaquinone biosynthesis C-methylase UbiE